VVTRAVVPLEPEPIPPPVYRYTVACGSCAKQLPVLSSYPSSTFGYDRTVLRETRTAGWTNVMLLSAHRIFTCPTCQKQ